jgi:diadenosine tetraphosphate (Ap4A) HIT family hydrolase
MSSTELVDFQEKFQVDKLLLKTGAYWNLSLRPAQITLCSMVLSSKLPRLSFQGLDQGSSTEMLSMMALAEKVAIENLGAKRINILCLMMQDPIVHFHIIPRYETSVDFIQMEWRDEDWPLPPTMSRNTCDAASVLKLQSEVQAYFT